MAISVFELFSIGIGPSSSHTVGPMRAAAQIRRRPRQRSARSTTSSTSGSTSIGSLAATGAGHGTMTAILLGLEGLRPETLETEEMERRLARRDARRPARPVAGSHAVALTEDDFVLRPLTMLPFHPNALTITARDGADAELHRETYFSVGGGFVVTEAESRETDVGRVDRHPSRFGSAKRTARAVHREPAARSASSCSSHRERQRARGRRSGPGFCTFATSWWSARTARHVAVDGYLPGALQVRRRAKDWFERLKDEDPDRRPEVRRGLGEPGGARRQRGERLRRTHRHRAHQRCRRHRPRGAALRHALHPRGRRDRDDTAVRFLLAAGAIGSLYKERASISGAEVGCQGEVGSAASMAAGGLAEILGGTPEQVENAAEIAHGAQPRADVRSDRGARPDSVHRAQRHLRGQGDQRRPDGAARRRHPPRQPRSGHRDDAHHRRRHAFEVQGDLDRRPRSNAVNYVEC